MRYQPANLLGGFYKDSSKPWSAQDTLNWIPEVAQAPGTRTEAKLRTAPGLKPFVEIGGNPVRGSHNCEGKLFVVSGNRLYQISNSGVAIPIGTVPGTGLVSFSHNQITGGNELVVVNGSAGYVYNTRTMIFQRISDPAFPGSIATDYLDQYILHVEPFGRYWFHSELADALNYNSLDRYESEASPDKIVTLKTNNLEVVVFNETTTEFFDNTGAANNTFQNKRAVIDVGAAGRFAVAKIDRSLIWLANDGVFYYLEGYNGRPISTPPIEQAISGFDWSRCIAKVYESEGHKIAYFTFPGGLTFGYDVVTQLWHRRGSFGMDRWRINSLTNWNRKYIAGDFQNGRLYELDWKYPLEADQPLVRERTSGVTSDNQNRIFVPYAEVIVDTGQSPVAPVPFPVQPAGPTITGDAPNGYVGQEYNYQYTLTEGDAPISGVRIIGNPLPAGWALSNTGLLTGTLQSEGVPTFTVRVTDTNGLYDEINDSITASALWWLMRVEGTDDNAVWVSQDPLVWTDQKQLSPFFGTHSISSDMVGGGKVVIPRALSTTGFRADAIPSGPLILDENTTIGGVVYRMRSFEGICFAFAEASVTYWYSTNNGATWTAVTPGGGLKYWDIARMNTGRWISYRELDSEYALVYSDQAIPTNWIVGAVENGLPGRALACNGEECMIQLTAARIGRTLDGASWEIISPGATPATDSRCSLTVGNIFMFGFQVSGGGGANIRVTKNRGLTSTYISLPQLFLVQRLHYAQGVYVASGDGMSTPSTTLVYVNKGDPAVQADWVPATMPYTIGSGVSAIAFPVTNG